MKRKVAPFLFFLFFLSSLSSGAITFSADLFSLDFLWKEGMRIDGEIAVEYESVQLTFPIRYGKSDDSYLNYIESGLLVAIHPIDGLGLFVEASFLKFGRFWGIASPSDELCFSSEGSVGWNVRIGMVSIKPRITYRVLLSSDGASAEALKKIPQFGGIRLSAVAGISIPIKSGKK